MAKVLRSEEALPLDQFISSVACSNIDRRKGERISLYMCQVSQSCPSKAIRQHRDASRMDIDMTTGKVRVWFLAYNSRKPDVIIENAVLPSRAK